MTREQQLHEGKRDVSELT